MNTLINKLTLPSERILLCISNSIHFTVILKSFKKAHFPVSLCDLHFGVVKKIKFLPQIINSVNAYMILGEFFQTKWTGQ